jgi:asparagine synthase (glutamine-hydrolysing)
MCGLVGILQKKGKAVSRQLLANMLVTLQHRGRDELVQLGHSFQTNSDTEVILRMYLQYGEECVARLNGMFAFLILDRYRSRVLSARDHLGVKPLYFRVSSEALLFASEIKALLQFPGLRIEPDESALRDYLIFQFVLGERTLFRGIHKVLPGQFQVINLEDLSVRTTCYWEPHFRVDLEHTEKYFVEQLRYLIEDAARIQMRSDVPLGTYLSGGLDSSIVTTLASRHSLQQLKTFTGAFAEGPEFDESEYAREVAEACSARSFVVVPGEVEFVEALPRLIWHMDEPAAGPGLFPQYILARAARREVKVVLGGQGGDEIFGGYARYVVAYLEQALKGAIFETNEEKEHIVSLHSILPNLPALKQYTPMLQSFWREGAFTPMDSRYFQLIDRSVGAMELYSDEFRETFDREGAFERFQKIFNQPDTKSYYNKMTHFDMVSSLPALLHVEDRVSMAASLESRVPLLDHRVVDLVTSMPAPLKFKGAEMKYALKRAIGDILPERILQRKDKMGFPVPLHLWTGGRAQEFMEDTLLSTHCRTRGLFDTACVEKLLCGELPFGRKLWGLLNLELWYRQFMDAPIKTETQVYATQT